MSIPTVNEDDLPGSWEAAQESMAYVRKHLDGVFLYDHGVSTLVEAHMARVRDKRVSGEDLEDAFKGAFILMLDDHIDRLATVPAPIETDFGIVDAGIQLKRPLDLVVILRAGAGMKLGKRAVPLLSVHRQILIQRDTAADDKRPVTSYVKHISNIEDAASRQYAVVDPAGATGGSMMAALELLIAQGAREEDVAVFMLAASPYCIRRIRERYPKMAIHVAYLAHALNTHMYLVEFVFDEADNPIGLRQVLWDAGARLDGTEE